MGHSEMTHADDDALRRDMDHSRRRIGDTVDEIERRVRPQHIMARRRRAVRQRLTDWKDSVFGNDEQHYPAPRRTTGYQTSADQQDWLDRDDDGHLEGARQRGAEAVHAVGETPRAVRRQTRGNPMAAGAIALGAGWLIGSLLPESRRERELAARAEPQVAHSVATAREEAEDMANSMKDDARDAADHVKDAGRDAAHEVSEHGKEAAGSVRKSG